MASLLLARRGDTHPGLLFEDRSWTWDEFLAEAASRSALQQAWRREAGDPERFHVGILLENVPEFLFQLLGAALSGVTVVGVNNTRRGEDLAADIRGTDVDVLVTASDQVALIEGFDHGAAAVHLIDSPEWDRTLADHDDAEPIPTERAQDPSTVLMLLFTSGSTGRPKAVILSTGRWAYICQVNPVVFERDEVAYNAMPLFHGNALMAPLGLCLRSGGTYALSRRFSASGFLGDVQRFGATYFNYVGRSLAYILAQPERPDELDNRLRTGFGTEASARDRSEFERRFGCSLYEGYGSSEGVCYFTATPETPEGAFGRPGAGSNPEVVLADGSPAAVARFDAEGVLVNPREAIGEIVGRGAAPGFEGYYNNPEASAEKIRGEDFWTGDLAYVDADGFFYFAGRTNDWMRVDSENLAAGPIERVLNRHPEVSVAAVYGVPDPNTGDQVMATLQVRDKETFDVHEFAEFCLAQSDLGTKWMPSLLRVTTDLPVTATSKVDKPTLRRQLWDGPDPVYERVAGVYRALDEERRDEIAAEFRAHDRANALHV